MRPRINKKARANFSIKLVSVTPFGQQRVNQRIIIGFKNGLLSVKDGLNNSLR